MTALTITLPWPSADLSPNARGHWASKSKAVKTARMFAMFVCLDAMQTQFTPINAPRHAEVKLVFYPPTKRHYDLDNLQARCKAYQDGVFNALGWDDKIIDRNAGRIDEVRACGEVEFILEWSAS